MNQEKIIQAIAAYLEFDTMDRFKKIYANRLHSKVTQDDINRYQSPPNEWPDDCVAIKSRRELIATQGKETASLVQEIARELAAAIAPHMEAGSGWEDAPSWANYIATDWNGQKHWFEKEPYKHKSGCWFNQEGTKYQKINYSNGDDWDFSLQCRPR